MLDSGNINEIDKNSPPKADQSRAGKIFFIVFGLLIAISVGVTYWRIMVKRDYIIEAQVDCDPYTEACFVWECDPASTVEGEKCTGDPESDIWYFKVGKRNASRIPLCDPNTDENCQPMLCVEGEKDCSEMLCTEDQLEAQYAASCVDPVKFTEENPIEEEATESSADEAECAEGDEECAVAEEVTEGAEETTAEEAETVEGAETTDLTVQEKNAPATDKANKNEELPDGPLLME